MVKESIDYGKALDYYKLAAEGGDLKLILILDICNKGLGVPQSNEKGFQFTK